MLQTIYVLKMEILHFLSSKSTAYKQERLQIERGLWWRAYGILNRNIRLLTASGTSSSFVQPPRGCNRSTGFWNPLSVSCLWQSFISNAWPLWTGFLSWKAKTASASNSLNFSLNSFGVNLERRKKNNSCIILGEFRENSRRISGGFRENSGRIPGAFQKNSYDFLPIAVEAIIPSNSFHNFDFPTN